MRFEFATAARIVFGAGTIREAGKIARDWGNRGLVVTGAGRRHSDSLLDTLTTEGLTVDLHSFAGEPSVQTVVDGLAAARDAGAEFVIGLGGGSAIDAAKAIAGLLTNPGDPLDFLEVVGRGKPLTRAAAPWMGIPTTAGTGAEVARNAVLTVPERRVKVSLRSPLLFARVALVDPELTVTLPPTVTAATGMDALTQLLEAYVCNRANPQTDALCAAGLPQAARALPVAWRQPQDLAARTALALASLWSGQALTNAGLGAVHGFAAPIGGHYSAPHGAVCATLLGPVMAANLAAMRIRTPRHPALARYQDVARWLTGRSDATADEGVTWVRDLTASLRIPELESYGLVPEEFREIADLAQAASSMKANPIALTTGELMDVLAAAGGRPKAN